MDHRQTFLSRYDTTACKAAHEIISCYSTSFGLATKLLRGRIRTDISNLYAMVRIADEIVDGTAQMAGLEPNAVSQLLDDYEAAVLAAPTQRFHADPILHAWALSARRCKFKTEHVQAFFTSMRNDLHKHNYETAEFNEYVYGSAEVIGLMCLDAFLVEQHPRPHERTMMEHGARSLGSAFQKINFLRDLEEDTHVLGRNYFPQLTGELTDATKALLVADIRTDLAAAYRCIPLLPFDARVGVQAAADLFTALTDRIQEASAVEVTHTRIRIPKAQKIAIITRAPWRALHG